MRLFPGGFCRFLSFLANILANMLTHLVSAPVINFAIIFTARGILPMRFEIEWVALVGRFKLEVRSVELVDARNSSVALNLIRSSIIAKLASLNSKFEMQSVSFINVAEGTLFSAKDQASFLQSINAEGCVVTTEEAPYRFQVVRQGRNVRIISDTTRVKSITPDQN